MDEQVQKNSMKVTQFQFNTRPNSAVKVKIPKKALKSFIFPMSRSHQNLKLQKFHPHSINIKSITKNSNQPLEIIQKKVITRETAENSLKKQSFSLQSIPEKGQFLYTPLVPSGNESEASIKFKYSRPSTARIIKNESLIDSKETSRKLLPKRGKDCVNEMLKIWNNVEDHKIFTEESEEDLVQRELLSRISDIDSYLNSEKPQKKPFNSSIYRLNFQKSSPKETFTNFGLQATKKPLTQRVLKSPNQTSRHN